MKYYAAYGSNLNKAQMARRCPDAVAVGTAWIPEHKLVFRRGYLTIEPAKGKHVDVGVYKISPEDEKKLDIYEGFPKFYHKERLEICSPFSGKKIKTVMVYIMNDGFEIKRPSTRYLQTVAVGFRDFGFGIKPLMDADLDACLSEMEGIKDDEI